MNYHESRKRSVAKAISWRMVATTFSLITAAFFTDKLVLSLEIAVAGAVVGTIAYYFHERLWNRSSWGRVMREDTASAPVS